MKKPAPSYGLFLAVLPSYRQNCINLLKSRMGDDLAIQVSSAHLDASVKTGIDTALYETCAMVRIGHTAFIQIPINTMPWRIRNLIIDLNPRSITAWALLIVRRFARRRTLVWGHIHPQAGGDSKTASLRLLMRKLASGTISYTHRDHATAIKEMPGKKVWVAPNAIYHRADITTRATNPLTRDSVIYVGRFEPKKKVDLLVKGFAEAQAKQPAMKLILIGDGSEKNHLRALVEKLHLSRNVTFTGWVENIDELRAQYGKSFAAVSPGFAGLGLTQSLGFGVRVAVAQDEPHSPEIELADEGPVEWFESDNPSALAAVLLKSWESRHLVPDEAASVLVRNGYSAENMANGLQNALMDM